MSSEHSVCSRGANRCFDAGVKNRRGAEGRGRAVSG